MSNGYLFIKSYADMRYANPFNSSYERIGFKEERLTGKTEWELRHDQGFDRIWDCGHRTYLFVVS